jgi:hypothetical protein
MADATQKRQITIAIALIVLLAIGVAVYFLLFGRSQPPAATQTGSASTVLAALANRPPSLPTQPTTAPQLHVGLYLSKMTGDDWGYSIQIVGELSRGGFDLVPILEPGSASVPEIQKLLGLWFKGKTSVSASDADALKKLDVIVAPRIWLIPDRARIAIESAVRNGTGLLARNGLGSWFPRRGPDIARLNGFTDSSFGYSAKPMECEFIGSHPILGTLSGQIGKSIQLTPNGTWGVLGSQTVPLIRVKDMQAFHASEGRGGADWVFYPLYVSQLGKGRIVGCQFPAWTPTPKDLMAATDQQFNIRAVKWLAHQLDDIAPTTTQPTTQPTTHATTLSAR